MHTELYIHIYIALRMGIQKSEQGGHMLERVESNKKMHDHIRFL